MTTKSSARSKLEKARFFATHASEAAVAQEYDAFESYIEAAIVFARSVTFCLQADYRHKPSFDGWYLKKQERMKNDSLFDFFRNERTNILKVRSVKVQKTVTITAYAETSSSFTIKVHRNQPWYRRSPRILWKDFSRSTIDAARNKLCKWKTKLRSQPKKRSETISSIEFFFEEPRWKDRPALDLLLQYLDKLELVVMEAEAQFATR
jgi:hypothetical protein